MKKLFSEALDINRIIRIVYLLVMDILAINFSSFFALFTRNELSLEGLLNSGYYEGMLRYAIINTFCSLAIFWAVKLYNSLWQYASAEEFMRIIFGAGASAVVQVFGMFLMQINMPRSFPLLYGVFLTGFVFSARFIYRLVRHFERKHAKNRKRTMLIGAGSAGAIAIRDINSGELSKNEIVCVIDDDKHKKGSYINGVKVVGGRNDIPEMLEKYRIEEVLYAIPSAQNIVRKDIFDICSKCHMKMKTLPGLYQLANGEVNINAIRDVQIEDLLGRQPVQVDMTGIAEDLKNRTVLVTGGGGSIGSELCRQLAKYPIARLIIFDIYENNAYDIQQELLHSYPDLDLKVLIGSVRDAQRVEWIFEKYHPDMIYHAAAHKHVPLMEESPCEAVKNNIFGTLNVAKAAAKYGAKRFLLISTDKAVNPTSIMGASKRVCEMIIQTMNRKTENTDFVAVRFGNVLGSNGSVIPLFRKQIENGGPVTVTHKDIIRYFMTIPEAVSLILQAGTFAAGGEIFVLDMGEPVHIAHLAERMIRLSGFEPGVDIQIVYTGLRPGEKLYEELLMSEEGMKKTPNEKIYIGHPIDFDENHFLEELEELRNVGYDNFDSIRKKMHVIVPTFRE